MYTLHGKRCRKFSKKLAKHTQYRATFLRSINRVPRSSSVNAIERVPRTTPFVSFFESVPSGETELTLSKRLFSSCAAPPGGLLNKV